jgi:4'-phosphopantetheinyl transferase
MDWLAAPPAPIALPAGELHLWRWHAEEDGLTRRQRVDRRLRQVLARYAGVAPEALAFGREAKGRPFLSGAGSPDFNYSDTGGEAVLAVAQGIRVGIDIERRDRVVPVERLARRWYSAEEAEALAALPEESARRAFLGLWTAKEASCKCTGTGLFGWTPRWRFELPASEAAAPLPAAAAPAAGRFHFLRLLEAEHTIALTLRSEAAPPRLHRYAAD